MNYDIAYLKELRFYDPELPQFVSFLNSPDVAKHLDLDSELNKKTFEAYVYNLSTRNKTFDRSLKTHRYSYGPSGVWGAFNTDRQLMSVVMLMTGRDSRDTYIGYAVSAQYRGHGVMTSTLNDVFAIIDERHPQFTLLAEIYINNFASEAVARSFGFEPGGVTIKEKGYCQLHHKQMGFALDHNTAEAESKNQFIPMSLNP
jgi:RimJ/RimL family protein N-acetyltransferase